MFSTPVNHTASHLTRFLAHVDAAGCRPLRYSSGEHYAFCPVCRRRKPTFTFGLCDNGKVGLTLHCGCDKTAVLTAINLTWADLCPAPEGTRKPLTDDELLDQWRAGERKPLPAGILERLPEDADDKDRELAEWIELRAGLQYSTGNYSAFAFTMAKNAAHLNWTTTQVQRRLLKFQAWGVLHKSGDRTIYNRKGRRKANPMFLYKPGPGPDTTRISEADRTSIANSDTTRLAYIDPKVFSTHETVVSVTRVVSDSEGGDLDGTVEVEAAVGAADTAAQPFPECLDEDEVLLTVGETFSSSTMPDCTITVRDTTRVEPVATGNVSAWRTRTDAHTRNRIADQISSAIASCSCCTHQNWWRLDGDHPWVCGTCHPPAPKAIEWQANPF